MTATKIYVGTFAKYNNGNLSGEWLELSDYSDINEFLDACAELHEDEEDPEFMFQDWEGPDFGMISESSVEPELFELLVLDEDELEMLEAWVSNGNGPDIDSARDAYQGKYDSDEDFAQEMAEQLGYLDRNVSWPYTCIDWEWAARELMYDYFESNGHYFRS